MRLGSKSLLTTSVLAGGTWLAACGVGLAQDASGPSTSGGSLPYISGQTPARSQQTSGDTRPAAPPATTPAPAAGETVAAPPTPPAPEAPARETAETPAGPAREPAAAKAPDAPPARAPTTAAKAPDAPSKPVRQIDLGKRSADTEEDSEATDVARQPAPPSRKPAAETAKSDRPVIDEPRKKAASPPRPAVASRPDEAETSRGAPEPRRPAVTERRPPKPVQPRNARRGYEADEAPAVVMVDPYTGRRYIRPSPPPPDERVARGNDRYMEDDEDTSLYVMRPRHAAPGWHGYPYYYPARPRVLRPYAPVPPQAYYRAPQQPAGNCHFHAFPEQGMRFHREIRCHWHEDAEHPSLRYAR